MTPARNLVDIPDLDRTVIERVIYALRTAPLATYPFPHFYAMGCFDLPFYQTLFEALGTLDYAPNEDGKYAGREFASPARCAGLGGFYTSKFASTVLNLFGNAFHERFPSTQPTLSMDLRLVRDSGGYSIGPHTDAPWKLVSLLFYLRGPFDTGTSIYVPKVPGTVCPGGPHHSFGPFVEAYRAPFIPGGCLGFWKTDNAWHGVAPLPADSPQRDVLLYNLYAGAPAPD